MRDGKAGPNSSQKSVLLEPSVNTDSGAPPASGRDDWSACCNGTADELIGTGTTVPTLLSMVHSKGLAKTVGDTVEVCTKVSGEKRSSRSVRRTVSAAVAEKQNDSFVALGRVKPSIGLRDEKSSN